jgi:transcriptional regulator with XRE-family HTH domain
VDVHVGGRIRTRRTLLGMSQTALGDKLGLTFQQVQKYERGTNRVSSSRLFEMSRIFGVPISFFFEDMTPETAAATSRTAPAHGGTETPAADDLDPLAKRETLELVRAYYRIADPRVRKRVFELTKALGKTVRGS